MSGEAEAAFADTARAKVLDAAEYVESIPVTLTKRIDAPPIGAELEALAHLRTAAKRLKAAELEFREAQQAYAAAVKELSEEAVK